VDGLVVTEIGWRKTFEENEEDYAARDETGAYVGRVYLVSTAGVAPYWGWFAGKGGSGKAESRRAAMLAVEEAWERRWKP
jgi:hypothetical protein